MGGHSAHSTPPSRPPRFPIFSMQLFRVLRRPRHSGGRPGRPEAGHARQRGHGARLVQVSREGERARGRGGGTTVVLLRFGARLVAQETLSPITHAPLPSPTHSQQLPAAFVAAAVVVGLVTRSLLGTVPAVVGGAYAGWLYLRYGQTRPGLDMR